ncbi:MULTISPECIES: siderophore-interacting protein [unclassified Pseudomonas]|uniref:siderophore-interacting protein n=1 Tax=unclassified Pseudomonas TaxID=196821 RepID=UPI002097CF05|nr:MULTISPECIES: siderophore-interacting protein [unclassified Pseudomonas]MCO7506967.1 siderophore-interacting protein [Pseudomonas sp. VE 267-6A]MCO7529956.1 siderophore-interacting protein [Pseudomonas sp. 2]
MTSASSLTRAVGRGLRKLAGAQPERAYRLFDVTLKQRIQLSPSLSRLVFTGPDVARMHTLAADQRVKLFFPAADGSPPELPNDLHWNEARRALAEASRPPMRTYTIRALRREQAEVDIDFVLHGVNGPASAWATHARTGDRLQILAPNLAFAGDPGGYEWNPPAGVRNILLVGDETALPAIAGILETLAGQDDQPQVEAYVEVPLQQDCLALRCNASTTLHWLPRDQQQRIQGQAMVHAVTQLATLPARRPPADTRLEEVDIDQQILWERASASHQSFYAWVAGESAAVMQIRRFLINEQGLDRNALTLMGYWRAGRTFE